MRRTIVAIIAGLVAWTVVVTVLDWGLRLGLRGYTHAESTLLFTLGMKIARPLWRRSRPSPPAWWCVRSHQEAASDPWIVGLVILALFLPAHIQLWHRFPIWYHLTFLVTLAPLVALGGWLKSRSAEQTPGAVAQV